MYPNMAAHYSRVTSVIPQWANVLLLVIGLLSGLSIGLIGIFDYIEYNTFHLILGVFLYVFLGFYTFFIALFTYQDRASYAAD
mmetsp:Transcript_35739/g.34775  ORF Transcript_35739/g.34775 Transcript_35739/m.34775 type:complete len:83 (-) Transcript_35739:141-389(-)